MQQVDLRCTSDLATFVASVAPMQHALRRGAASYAWSLQHRHLLTTTSSGALLGVAGDALTQLSADGTYDSRRGAAFGAFGAVLTGPINYVWLGGLQRAVQFVAPAGGAAAVASKVAAQSTVMQPFIYLPTFFGVEAAVRGRAPDAALVRARELYWPTLQKLWACWTPAVIFAFARLPTHQQAVFFAACSFAWNAVLSFVSNPEARREGER